MAKSILVADDSVTIRKVVELTFSGSDYHVETVDSGSGALERLGPLQPDVVLADVVMPEPSGYEICRQVKTSDRPIPVVLLAGAFESFDEERARECGADGCLTKPFESDELLELVDRLVGRETALPERSEPVVEAAPRSVVPGAPEPMPPVRLTREEIAAIAREVVALISPELVREVARDIVPGVAERLVRERIRQLESEEE